MAQRRVDPPLQRVRGRSWSLGPRGPWDTCLGHVVLILLLPLLLAHHRSSQRQIPGLGVFPSDSSLCFSPVTGPSQYLVPGAQFCLLAPRGRVLLCFTWGGKDLLCSEGESSVCSFCKNYLKMFFSPLKITGKQGFSYYPQSRKTNLEL